MSAARDLGNAALGTPEERALACKLADSFLRRLPKSVLREDVHQAALIGLWDGLRKTLGDVTPEQRKGYLITRIRGQIIDELRAQDWLQRRARQGQDPNAPSMVIVRFDDLGHCDDQMPWLERHPDPSPGPEERLLTQAEANEALGAPLTQRHRHVVRGHYWHGKRFVDIAGELGTSEPRVSQIHAQAVNTMRAWCTGELPDRRAHWNNDGKEIRREARLAIEQRQKENHEHRGTDRGAREPAGAPARPGAFPCAVPVRWLGGPPAPAARRPVSRGAGGAELGGEALPRVCLPRSEAVAAGAAADPGGGLAVSAAATEVAEETPSDAVPSVLPEEGIALPAELTRYRDWLVQQALLQSGGNKAEAARRLGIKRTTLVMMLANVSARVAIPPMKQSEATPATPDAKLEELVARIPWDEVAQLRAEGMREWRIVRKIAHRLDVHHFAAEKALRQPRPLAKCGP